MEPRNVPMQIRGLAAASACLGFLSCILFWWFPHGLVLASCAFVLGVFSLIIGVRGGRYGENLALAGVLYAMAGGGAAWTCYRVMSMLMSEI